MYLVCNVGKAVLCRFGHVWEPIRNLGHIAHGAHNTSSRYAFFGLLGLIVWSGCGASYYLDHIKRTGQHTWAVYDLGKYPDNPDATRALVEMLNREDADTRCAAAIAIRSHLNEIRSHLDETKDHDMRCAALRALVNLLDDTRDGKMHYPVFGLLLPGMTRWLGFVRLEALLTLSYATAHDCGYDRTAWSQVVDQECWARK